MKRWIALFFLVSSLVGCATTSEPTRKTDRLTRDEGVVIFSTADDGSTSTYMHVAQRSYRAVMSLGLSELVGGVNDLEIHFAPFDPATKSPGKDFFVAHSYRTQEEATARKWHVLKLKAGSYTVTSLIYRQPNGFNQLKFAGGMYRFDVKAGESLYLGDIALAFGNAPVENQNGEESEVLLPQIKEVDWNMDEASHKLASYYNYPATLNKAEFEVRPLKKGR